MRYLPLSDTDRTDMLAKIGVKHIDELFADIPADKLQHHLPQLPVHKGELEVERLLGGAQRSGVNSSFFRWCRCLQTPRSLNGGSSDPAVRIFDELHALPA